MNPNEELTDSIDIDDIEDDREEEMDADDEIDPEEESDWDRSERIADAKADAQLQEWKDSEIPGWNGKFRGEK